ncbi:hypothetical protein GCM10010987_49680 [Bradyrhizobium guangdongense]|uniref:Uncharacterized protein n=1 Tax=Bradyrhizobium guangdongense TaxID=1325090 RepID=A0AA88BA66_9BRAD|nr:hypothetical protein GCM10010987_49680 [Bradyrhizobium guangdongense]
MVKTEVSARVSSWLFFLNRKELIGKRGNIPPRERTAGWPFIENNPMHSRAAIDFKDEFVGWAKRRGPRLAAIVVRWWARRNCAFAHPTKSYSAAICRGAGGGLARSAASWA